MSLSMFSTYRRISILLGAIDGAIDKSYESESIYPRVVENIDAFVEGIEKMNKLKSINFKELRMPWKKIS
jgi:hypothetical protein